MGKLVFSYVSLSLYLSLLCSSWMSLKMPESRVPEQRASEHSMMVHASDRDVHPIKPLALSISIEYLASEMGDLYPTMIYQSIVACISPDVRTSAANF